MNNALMDRVERSIDSAGSAYSLFENNIYLQQRIHERTTALEHANEEMLKAKRQAEAASLAKSMFLANMSHELRTPLSAINGFASILLRETYGELNERQKQHAGNILSSGEHLLGIINDLLDLAKIEAGKLEMTMASVNLAQISMEARAMVEDSLNCKDLQLSLEIPDFPVFVNGDALRLRQAILNLLSNAIKFTEEGSVTIFLRQHGKSIEWGVKDTGIGIEHSSLDSLFKPFERIKTNLSDTVKGTGLGLALTKQIVDSHGGELVVDSTFGVGSEFCIRLPLMEEQYGSDNLKVGVNYG